MGCTDWVLSSICYSAPPPLRALLWSRQPRFLCLSRLQHGSPPPPTPCLLPCPISPHHSLFSDPRCFSGWLVPLPEALRWAGEILTQEVPGQLVAHHVASAAWPDPIVLWRLERRQSLRRSLEISNHGSGRSRPG